MLYGIALLIYHLFIEIFHNLEFVILIFVRYVLHSFSKWCRD
jgi:hypothetical protein